ncbi:hypothetical protein POTOM_033457 [Populus tomentosa]|uniref:Uncharacterized protein n=1 Tax=Populus tomentosa TaxID=118781 RepID=A0A8X7Z6A9_POPTO|nr:hypothetical protein POTOM_033457 [Populus tomentosa]
MGFRLCAITRAKQILQLSPSAASQIASNVPKGCLAVYVGEIQKKRFIIPGNELVSWYSKTGCYCLLRLSCKWTELSKHHSAISEPVHDRRKPKLANLTSDFTRPNTKALSSPAN